LEDFKDMDIEEIRGAKKKPDAATLLNQKHLSPKELDEIFLEGE
jgi:hypothetical protein